MLTELTASRAKKSVEAFGKALLQPHVAYATRGCKWAGNGVGAVWGSAGDGRHSPSILRRERGVFGRVHALTIPAYLPELTGTFLIEEPENGIHPRALETVLQSLSSIYGGQVLMATHSAVALNLIKPAAILCFAKDRQGATDIVSGKDHPALKEWKQGEPDLGLVFATGILS